MSVRMKESALPRSTRCVLRYSSERSDSDPFKTGDECEAMKEKKLNCLEGEVKGVPPQKPLLAVYIYVTASIA